MRKRDVDLIFSIVGLVALIAIVTNVKYIGTSEFSTRFQKSMFVFFGLVIAGILIIIVSIFLFRTLNVKTNTSSTKENSQKSNTKDSNESLPNSSIGDFLEKLRNIDWYQFEQITGIIYKKLGFRVSKPAGAKPDSGIDFIIEKDFQQYAVQCKHWRTRNVGVRAVREFLGALQDSGIKQGIFVTLCGYTGEAKQFAERNGIEILNETGLLKMVEQSGARFDPEVINFLNDKRKFCPKCGNEMVLRVAKKGIMSGKKFWGCTAYPECHFKMHVDE